MINELYPRDTNNLEKPPFWHQPESRRIEFKEAWPSGDGIARTAVAFANGAGGKIVFGVREEPREIVGISDAELFALEEKAANHIFDLCHPTIVPEIFIQEETLISLERARRNISYDEVVNYELPADEIDLSRFTQDYETATGSDIKVAIFDDMLEITSPGPLPDTLPIDTLGSGRSEIRNRVLAPIFKDIKLIEAWGTGIQKMREEASHYPNIDLHIHEADYAFQVQFVNTEAQEAHEAHNTMEDTMHVTMEDTVEVDLLKVLKGEMTRAQLQEAMLLKNVDHFRKAYLLPAIEKGLIERTIPDKPRSKKQKYRLKPKGKRMVKK